MKQFALLYEENKKLDTIYTNIYGNDSEIFKKNALELLVELGELANETRCFKYWSIKKPSDREIILDEYADCLLMTLCFANTLDVNLEEEYINVEITDTIEQFIVLYKETSMLTEEPSKDRIKRILANLINLGHLIGFNDDEIIKGSIAKINTNKERLSTNY